MKPIDNKGFTLIELLIVIAIVAILASIALPAFIGMQDRGKKGSLIRAASSSEAELQAWLLAAYKGIAGNSAASIEVDSDGDGQITAADANNSTLGSWWNNQSLDDAYVNAKQSMHNEFSPWDQSLSLWVASENASMQIAVSQVVASSAMRVEASDRLTVIHTKTLYSD